MMQSIGMEEMKMPKFNKQQLKAIQTKEKNIMVSASAGSGKTTVLIERLMDLVVKDLVPIDAILAMTFTEAAANEMKKRLAASLQQALQQAKSSEEQAYISKQLTNIQTAHISTIHSFCLSILQDYYYIIGLDAERISHIMDNGTMVLFQEKALEYAFQIQHKQNNPTFAELCMMFSTRNESDETLRTLITNLATLANSQPDPETWLNYLLDLYTNKESFDDIPQEILQYFFEYLSVCFTQYKEYILSLNHLYVYRYDSEVKKADIVRKKVEYLKKLENDLSAYNYDMFCLDLQSIAHCIIPTSPDKEDTEYAKLRKQIQDLEDSLLKILFSKHRLLSDINSLYPYIKIIVQLVKDYRNHYAKLKEMEKVIDFDDMEHFALEILQCNDGQVADLYRQQFKEIMVDEFQDSNEIQNTLVQLICRKNNVFRVGDIKQSIYKFRHAKPQLMRRIIENKGKYDEVIYLSNNYRSKKMVVDFNNLLFEHLMNLDGFSCSYADEDNVEVGVDAQKEDNVPICFHAIFHNQIKQEQDLRISMNDIKASYIANQILEIKEKENRKWKDFVVLTRSNSRKENMKKIFDELNIPYFIDVKTGFYQSTSVQLMISTLKAIVNPHDDIAYIATMTAPLFMCKIQEMANIKLQKRAYRIEEAEKTNQDVYELSYYGYLQKFPTEASIAFEALRNTCNNCSLTETLNNLFNQNDFYASHTTIQEKTNLDLLFDKAVQFEQQHATGIHAFLTSIDQIKDAQTAEAIPIGSEADVVRVMSIHQSKGLQFPVVFLWSTDSIKPIEFNDFGILDNELGIAIKKMELPERFMRTTLYRIAMEHKINKENLEEEMRILYVATTRAQQQMHIVDCIKSMDEYKKPLTTSSIYERKGYTSWVLQYFIEKPNELFTIKEVHQFWNSTPVPVTTAQSHEKLIYQLPSKSLQFTSATQHKTNEITFQLQYTKGSQYGTYMHKMIESLNFNQWDDENIKKVANSLQFPISKYDIQKLKNLHSNPLFQEALQHTCYHELPYVVQNKDEILHGFMDFVSISENTITIIDFKTDALDDPNDLIQRYRDQLCHYHKAMSILYPNHKITCYIYSFHLSEMIIL